MKNTLSLVFYILYFIYFILSIKKLLNYYYYYIKEQEYFIKINKMKKIKIIFGFKYDFLLEKFNKIFKSHFFFIM